MAVLLSGKPVAEHMCRDIRLRCEKLSCRGVTPTLGIVRVGRREEDIAYERGAIRRAESLNIAVRRFLLPADASQQELIQTPADSERGQLHPRLPAIPPPAAPSGHRGGDQRPGPGERHRRHHHRLHGRPAHQE